MVTVSGIPDDTLQDPIMQIRDKLQETLQREYMLDCEVVIHKTDRHTYLYLYHPRASMDVSYDLTKVNTDYVLLDPKGWESFVSIFTQKLSPDLTS